MMKRCDKLTGEPLFLQVCGEAHSATGTVQKKIIVFFFFFFNSAWHGGISYSLIQVSALIFGKGLNLNIAFLSQSCTKF